ncbi:DinB family protein [Paractinoplanes maris]|uniref:DinB family protein n=1 Tax=Paractinoplanes maris TaxID=1734446 RepID=UPI0020200AF4|nr:DinB family protein [Actinoplanes maris]
MDVNWNETLREQWTWHWDNQVRARLDGLTDDEYFWSPVPGAWTVRPEDNSIDYAFPQPIPAPFTTIAWRLGHVIVGVLAMRNAAHFGAPAASYGKWRYATTAAEAMAQLEEQLGVWLDGVRSLGSDGLARPCGDTEPYPELPMAALVLHIHRELIHHLSEVCLLRDLHLRGAGR